MLQPNKLLLQHRNFFLFIFSITFMLGFALYMSISFIWSLDISNTLKYILITSLFLFSQSMIFTRALVISHYKVPALFLYFLGYATCFFVLLAITTLARDSIAILLSIFQNILPLLESLHFFLLSSNFNLFLIITIALLTPLGMFKTLHTVRVHSVETPIKNLPEPFHNMRIAHLSDLHIGSIFGKEWLKQVVDKTNKAKVDIILITGDLVDGTPENLLDSMSVLRELKAPLGVHIVSGNHEYYSGFEEWKQIWNSWDFNVLVNEHEELNYNNETFTLAGLPDKSVIYYDNTQKPDIEQALKNSKSDFTILMSHPPKNAKHHEELGVNLQLSGHTHAGQCFFIFPLIKYRNQGFRSGIYHVDNMTLHVSPGTGLWGYAPLRIGTCSEISILELRAKHQ